MNIQKQGAFNFRKYQKNICRMFKGFDKSEIGDMTRLHRTEYNELKNLTEDVNFMIQPMNKIFISSRCPEVFLEGIEQKVNITNL